MNDAAVVSIESEESRQDQARRLEQVLPVLSAVFAERLAVSQAVREQHANQLTWLPAQVPEAVVFARSTEEVQHAVRACAAHGVPVIPYGTGTGMEGQVNAPRGGVSLDLSGMDRIVAVREEDMDCTVEAGVTHRRLNEHLRDTGLFFPVDPGADASLGGMAATRASGTNAVRYGTMRDNVLSLTVVTADGEVRKTGARARKSAAGLDLTRLFIGSEGALGVITELTLRLAGVPESVAAGICQFPSVADACNATIAAIQTGLPVARIELLDEFQMAACIAHSKLDLPPLPTLFVEFHGGPGAVEEQTQTFRAIIFEYGCKDFEAAIDPERRRMLWQARHDAFWAAKSYRPGKSILITDVCIPISMLAACIEETRADMKASGLEGPVTGHVGDGNFHVGLYLDPADEAELSIVRDFTFRLAQRAIAMEGTCTGEHGVGQGKIRHVEDELPTMLPLMKAIKHAFDPAGILNPGKLL